MCRLLVGLALACVAVAATPPVRIPETSARYRLALEREAVAQFG